MSENASQILQLLEPLFEEAEKSGLWFYAKYQSIWLHPKELRAEHAKGKFVWGPVNWILRNPEEYIDFLRVEAHQHDQEAAIKRLRASEVAKQMNEDILVRIRKQG